MAHFQDNLGDLVPDEVTEDTLTLTVINLSPF